MQDFVADQRKLEMVDITRIVWENQWQVKEFIYYFPDEPQISAMVSENIRNSETQIKFVL